MALAGWSYRKPVTLSRASGAVTNYQMKLNVGESAGSGANDVLATGCKTDFSDLRFTTAADGLLDYWIESVSGVTPNQVATIWIEFDSIGTGATTFYMYYGNAGASAVSSIANTFVFGDDFNRTNSPTVGNGWTEQADADYEILSNSLVTTPVTNSAASLVSHGSIGFSGKMMVEARMKRNTATQISFEMNVWDTTNTHNYAIALNQSSEFQYLDDTSPFWHPFGSAAADTFYIIGLMLNADAHTANYHIDRAAAAYSDKAYYPRAATWADTIHFGHYYISGAPAGTVDWILVRKWDATEPAWGAWGAEEPLGGGSAIPVFLSQFRRRAA